MGEHRRRRPVERAVDLCVYAPLGLLFEVPHLLPRLIERGRREAGSAVESGLGLIGRGDAGATPNSHARNTMRALGLVPDLPEDEDEVAAAGAERGADLDGAGDRGAPAVAPPPDVPVESGPAAETLAIPDYESLSASQVVPRLQSLASGELDDVRQFEAAHRHRSTILNKIAQLQAG